MSIFTVTNLNNLGVGSLRAAIDAANADPAASSTITFTVNGTISLATDLPAIAQNVTIDGASAPTHVPGGPPVVEIDCNGHGGLVLAAGSEGSQLLGLAICRASGAGVTLNAGSISLDGNYIGLDLAGAPAGNGGDGLHVSATSSNNLIGLNPTKASHVVSNVISGNTGNGITFDGSSGNTLVDNRIGTNPAGTAAIANGGNGIRLTGGSNGNTIGGNAFTDTGTGAKNDPTGDKGTIAPTFVVPPLGNQVSGNGQNGILIDANSRNNVLSGNFVGTTSDGNGDLGNALDGVAINGADNNSLIGCTFIENPFVYYNVLSGNGGNGLHVTDSDGTTVQANFFGVGANNSTIVSNAFDGILVDGSSMNTQVGGVIPLGNVSAGNGTNGIEVKDTASFFTSFNTFGGLLAFQGAAPNGEDGIKITSTGGNQTLQTNVLSGNLDDGIEISGNAFGVTVDPNIVGLDTNGQNLLPNGGNGIEIGGNAHDNVIGGHQVSVIPRNAFSGNLGYGIVIKDNAHDNWVLNSDVGTNVLGIQPLGNKLGGILIAGTANHNKIGDVTAPPTQPVAVLVSGNGGNGITLDDGTSFSTILNNIVGADRFGIPMPNTGEPIDVNASADNTIEGNQVVACFTRATRIATPDGDIAVEDLREGDLVRTLAGRAAPVQWIGHRHVDCRRHAAPTKVQPVRIAAHAFADNQPARDLFLSPDHSIHVDDVLIPVRYLINGTTIVQMDVDTVGYFHVELDRHDVLLAEGLPTESYLDTGDRGSFANGGGAVALHPAWGRSEVMLVIDALGVAPLYVTGPHVEGARAMLAARARRGTAKVAAGKPVRRRGASQPATAGGKAARRAGGGGT
ncbi:MAG: Hint domain-containing protein [Acetobacteraceae bacterium]